MVVIFPLEAAWVRLRMPRKTSPGLGAEQVDTARKDRERHFDGASFTLRSAFFILIIRTFPAGIGYRN